MKNWVQQSSKLVVEKLKQTFLDIAHVSASLDIWSDVAHSSYLGITLHILDKSFTPRSRFIGLRLLKGSHTGVYIREVAEDLLGSVGLSLEKLDFVVTDNGSNVVCAFKTDVESKIVIYL
jgi:hypothetical protein